MPSEMPSEKPNSPPTSLHFRIGRMMTTGSSYVLFGEIDAVFSVFRDVEIDMAVMRVESEIA